MTIKDYLIASNLVVGLGLLTSMENYISELYNTALSLKEVKFK